VIARPIPCRLTVAHAVYMSKLDKALRPVALAFAWFADDDGGNVWPSIATVSQMVGSDARSVRRRLSQLRALGGLQLEDPVNGLHGGHGKSTRYRFNLTVLGQLCRKEPGQRRQGFQRSKPGHQRQGFAETTLTAVVKNPDISDQVPGQIVHETLTPASADLYEPTGTNNELTDAAASESRLREENPKTPNGTPFKVFAAIATEAVTQSIREDKTDRFDNVLEWFKRGCAQQHPPLPYDSETARKAVEAALHAKAKAAAEFHSKFRQIAGGRSLQ
jgi:hypothetical protein